MEREHPGHLTVDQGAWIDVGSQVEQVPRAMKDARLLGEVQRCDAVAPGGDLNPTGVDMDVDEVGQPVGEASTVAAGDPFSDDEAAAVSAVLKRGMVVGFDPGVGSGPAAPAPSPRTAGVVERDL
ncbi:hypothetical protein [Actinoallomurus acaciae]|uniref:Uncharacterized protein n=1 Tax=Actinoallomurus acaciae TaxID=502577 RepID=A0ABV5Y9X4_9ACTN